MAEKVNKDDLLIAAKQFVKDGRFDRALSEYQKMLAQDPNDLRLMLRIAEIHVKLKQLDQAIRNYREVAVRYTDEGFYLKSVTVYKTMLRLNPSLHEANMSLAELYEKMGLELDAVHQYQILLRHYEQKRMTEKVLELRRRIVSLEPDNIANRVRLAEAYQLQGDEESSLREYEILAEQLKDSGDEKRLLDLYEKIITKRPDHLEMLRRLCAIYLKRNEPRKILEWIKVGEVIAKDDPELLRLQARCFEQLNQHESARSTWNDIARLHVEREENEEALKAYEEALVLAPDEEGELKRNVERLMPGSYEKMEARAVLRRGEQLRAEAAREALELAREEAAARIRAEGERSDEVDETMVDEMQASTLTSKEQEAVKHSAEACVNIGEACLQMGLVEEGKKELEKGIGWYRRLLAAGAGDEGVVLEMKRIEDLLKDPISPDETLALE